MFFVDEAQIVVRGGKGGDGCASFRREKYVPRGGPAGGDGGRGGSVLLKASQHVVTLSDMRSKKQYFAEDGRNGMGKKRHGRSGEDIAVQIPVGTTVTDLDTGLVLKDFTTDGETVTVAHGGQGGRGNCHFATATNRAPRNYEDGKPGQERTLRLELKLVADVGIIGMPNAGKSTLLSRLSSARPKVAPYPFTTLQPCLGIVELSDYRRFVMADMPGLIEGAHAGAGLGEEFLRHIERTRLLLHVVDAAPPAPPEPVEAYRTIRRELEMRGPKAASKPEMVVANKMDLPEAEEHARAFAAETHIDPLRISALTGEGLDDLKEALWQRLQDLKSE